MNEIKGIAGLFGKEDYFIRRVAAHQGGRNEIYILEKEDRFVLRLSRLHDRTEESYLAETEFVHYLAQNGASVADVIPSVNRRLVERINENDFASLFEYAHGMLISDNGYRYREGAPLSEYFFNTGKALGKIHALSKTYQPKHLREDYFDKYNMDYIGKLVPDSYKELKAAIAERLDLFGHLPKDREAYGLVHFDFSDGNYHIDMVNGNITAFDFDNSIYCWYMFDLANLWTHGVGWCDFEPDPYVRRTFMENYFAAVLSGYRTETDISDRLVEKLPLFIDMVLIENIVDEFECCQRDGEEVDYEDIEDAAESLIQGLPMAGFFEN